MRTLVLLNPEAGSAGERDALREALGALSDVDLRETRSGAEVRARARRARNAGYERVVAAGGDGTIHAVANGLAETPAPPILGILPLGTANDFARSLGFPDDVEGAVEVLKRGCIRPIDLVAARGRTAGYFVNVAVGGFGGRIQELADPVRKRALGPLEYLRSAAEALPELRSHRVVMELDGERVAVDAYHVLVANGRRSGGNIPVAPEARLDDGRVDVIVIPALDAASLLVLVAKILIGRHLEDENVFYRRVSALAIQAEPRMRFSLDGEAFGADPVTFRILPGAMRVAVPGTARQAEDAAVGAG